MTSAAGIIFFSYIGLDAVSTAGEEVRDPRRTLPRAIIIALLTVSALYIAVAIVAVAAQPAAEFEGQEAGLAAILERVTGSTWPGTVLAAGAVISIFSVTLVTLYGQTRILFAMGRDGMIPPFFRRVSQRTFTPVPATIVVAVVVSLLAGLLPIEFLAEMTSIGTLVAFLVVSIGVIALRRTQPDLPRGFRVPGYPVTPLLSIAGCLWIISDLRGVTIAVFFGWAAVALSWYALYGLRHSALARGGDGVVTFVVGVAPDGSGRAVLQLAALLARSAGAPLVVCTVVPAPWPPGPARVDAEYRDELAGVARDALAQARERLGDEVPATYVAHHARSAPAGLLEVAEEHGATLVVVGSSSAGVLGHVALGSVSDRLVHSSPLPVALAPRGFRAPEGARIARVTAACGGPHDTRELVVAAGRVAARVGAGLRVASFAVRARPPYTSGVGREGEAEVLGAWVERLAATAREGLEEVRGLPEPPPALETVVGAGESWPEALEDVAWGAGDVLVVGSSRTGPLARVFLGSRAAKIVRHAPVPVIVVPRAAAAELTSS